MIDYSNEEAELLEFVKKFVNYIGWHQLDTDKLHPEIQDILRSVEMLAMEIEENKFEK